MSTEETIAKVANAFRAMKAIGFSEDKVKPVFKELMKLYGKNWAYIQKDNYRVLADAMFQTDKTEAAEGSNIVDSEAVEHSNKVVRSELRVKRPRQEYPPSDTPKVPLVTPKEEPNELTQTRLPNSSDGKSKEIHPISPQTPSTEKGPVADGSSVTVLLKEPNIDASTVLTPKTKSFSDHALTNPKDGRIAETLRADHNRKGQPTEIVESQALHGFVGVNEMREKACALAGDGRPAWFIDYMRADTVTDDKMASVPDSVRKASEIPLRVWNTEFEGLYQHMDFAEQYQFAVALLGQALNFLVGHNEDEQKLAHEYADLGKRHQAMKDAHATCLSEIESIKTEKARLEKRAMDAETLALARDKHLGKALEYLRSTQARLSEAVAEASAAKSQAAEAVRKAREEGFLAGKTEGTKAYLASDECKDLLNWTHVACYDDLIRRVEAGATVEELKADRGRYMEENGLAASDKENEEATEKVEEEEVELMETV